MVERGSDEPVSGALVTLLTDSGSPAGRTLTAESGAFDLTGIAPGAYRLRVERIGYRTWRSPSFEVREGRTVTRVLRVPVQAVELPPIRASSCVSSPQEVAGLAELWREIRTALRIQAWTEEEGLYRFATQERRRVLRDDPGPSGRRVLEEDVRRREGIAGLPYASAPPESLAAGGYVQPRGKRLVYFGPDARTLLSESFQRTHCFYARSSDDDHPEGWVGLAFEPAPGRELPDVEGVLWLDRATSELRHLEFRFTELPGGIEDPRMGGRVEFARLGDGTWIVRRWRLRIPDVSVDGAGSMAWIGRSAGWRISEEPPPDVTVELRELDRETGEVTRRRGGEGVYDLLEESGEVISAGAGPGRISRNEAVRVSGFLLPADGAEPVRAEECRVRVPGTDYFAVPLGDGSFHLPSLPPGSLRLRATAGEGARGGRAPGGTIELLARPGRSYHVTLEAAGCGR